MAGGTDGTAWAALPDGPATEAARRLVDTIAGRPRAVPSAVRPDLGAGGAGLALAYHQLDLCRPGEGWRAMAVGHLEAAVRGAERTRLRSPGLLGGLGGLAFAAGRLGRPDLLGPDLFGPDLFGPDLLGPDLLGPDTFGPDAPEPGPDRPALDRRRALDLGSGLTGRGAVLLDRHARDPGAAARLAAVLTALGGQTAAFPGESPGMAHGPAGPLALLALARSAGVEVPGHVAALRQGVDRLLTHRRDDDWGPDWVLGPAPEPNRGSDPVSDPDPTPGLAPALGPAPPDGPAAGPDRQPLPASWCHGAPGIARALWLAGTALDDAPLRELARASLLAALRRPPGVRRVDRQPGLCHGLAGLLLITLRFARDTADPVFRQAAGDLLHRLADRYGAQPAVAPGLLDGAAGVLLVLLAATAPVPPDWDRALLLS
ncbi:lanthionine synthetase LanC family protein [Kitasatospora sp. NPDC056446]|uniref:lanthionine synthetase LanC family protein n=1 Tax=Kitasatospora sp. NPDC056446 TaxID=3345819 RepID=UPI00369F0C93